LSTVLDAASADRREWMPERILRSRARLAPQDAMRQLAEGNDLYGWKASNWWFDELAAADPEGLAASIRMRARRSEDPLTELVFYYGSRPEAMDAETLERYSTLLPKSSVPSTGQEILAVMRDGCITRWSSSPASANPGNSTN
jgi:hypothetical protein